MYLEYVSKLDASTILSSDLFIELFSIEDAFEHEVKLQELEKRASELNVKTQFAKLYKAMRKNVKSIKQEIAIQDQPSFVTEFEGQPELRCGIWRAGDDGVWTLGDKGRLIACYHPIYPKTILVNAESNTCKVEICFKIRGRWKSTYVDRRTVASKSSIISLADSGVQVTSENAGLLVQYLSDVEALNEDIIVEQTSTSRLGWINQTFMPYGKDVIFDNEQNLHSLFNSINQVGQRNLWYQTISDLRKAGRIEILMYIAASLGSVLVEPVGALPFIVDLWGETGKGKTVALMVATSIWADPSEGAYMTDAKATTTAMEIRLNILNSLPMTLDDMAQIKNQYDGDFSELVYRWCAGKGRDRSNVNLGLNKLTSWHNCILTNAEHSLITETMQGGAINRIIDIEMGDGYICDGPYVSDIVRNNYGWCGKEFVEQVQLMGFDAVRDIHKKYVAAIKDFTKAQGVEKEEKQIIPMSIIMTADEIAENYLFKDGVRLDMETCCNLLKNRGEVSEHKRAYELIRDTIASNIFRFNVDEDKSVEQWGYIDNPNVVIIGKIFDKIMKDAGFQSKAFLAWAKKNNIVKCDSQGNAKIQHKIGGINTRCVELNLEWCDENEKVINMPIDINDSPFD